MKKPYILFSIIVMLWACLPSLVSAHAYITKSTPLPNSELTEAPSSIKLTFSEDIDVKLSSVTLENRTDGTEVEGELSKDGDKTLIYTIPVLKNGKYKVTWQVLSADTHIVDGSFVFTVGVELEANKPDDTVSLDGGGESDASGNGNVGATAKPTVTGNNVSSAKPVATAESVVSLKPSATPKATVTANVTAKPTSTETPNPSAAETPVPSSVETAKPAESGGVTGTAKPEESSVTETMKPGEARATETIIEQSDASGSGQKSTPIANVNTEVNNSPANESNSVEETIAIGENEEIDVESESHDHAGGQRLMVILRIFDVFAAILLGGILFFRFGLWRGVQGKAPFGFSQNAERVVMVVAALIWIASGGYRVNMLVEQFGGIEWSTIVTTTMVGQIALLRPAAALLLFVLAFAPSRDDVWSNPLKGIITLVIVATFPLTGHAFAASSGMEVSIVAHIVHMATAAIWVGGLAGIWSLTYQRNGIEQLNKTAERFSKWALTSIIAIIISGVWLTATQLSALEQLWSSEYGRLALAKIIILILVIGIAAIHRSLRAKAKGARALIIGVRLEIVLAVGLILLAGWLSTTSPPPAKAIASGEPIYWHVMGEKAHMTLKINVSDGNEVQLARLNVWTPESLDVPKMVSIAFIPAGDSTSSSNGEVVIPVEPIVLENEPFSFPGFTKHNYEGEGMFFTSTDAGKLTVDITDAAGEVHHYERELGSE
ncbi:copper resistance protein CopC [Paenibacillus sp. GSMTC-2017]|uniref:copper resistance protein CopC n=1 Tax=Paenibacillus sp. GSMTC-2017 TaxID=2794350 RepID=UPI0018D8EB3C|nr:copper resistance protein CopC [Paenibacillus sp. GSMTC-2017]MBH5319101.1 copper resistance protein CopC [Paenibacillus sp. GSMTC-2017]